MWKFLRGGATLIPGATFIPESRVFWKCTFEANFACLCFYGKMNKEMRYICILRYLLRNVTWLKKDILGYLRFCQVFRFFLSSGDHGGLFHWLDRIVVGLFVFVAQKASQIGPSKWYQIVYDHLCIGLRVRFFMSSKFKQKLKILS